MVLVHFGAYPEYALNKIRLNLTKSYTFFQILKNLENLLGGEPMPKKKWGKAFVKKAKNRSKISF